MTTLIIITLMFLVVMVIAFAAGIIFTFFEINTKVVEFPKLTAILGMMSVLGLIWSIVSIITLYNLLP